MSGEWSMWCSVDALRFERAYVSKPFSLEVLEEMNYRLIFFASLKFKCDLDSEHLLHAISALFLSFI